MHDAWSTAFALDNQHLVFLSPDAGGRFGSLFFWDFTGTSPPRRLAQGITCGAQTLNLGTHRSKVVTLERDRGVISLDITTGAILSSFPTLDKRPSLCASPDESKMAVATTSGLGVEIWDTASGRLVYSLPEQNGGVWWLAWSPDSERLAVSRESGDVAIWNLPQMQKTLARLGLSETSVDGRKPVLNENALLEEYVYPGGYFGRISTNNPARWKEGKTDSTAADFYFEEVKRDDAIITLKDVSRGMTIELPIKGGESRFSCNAGTTWTNLYKVRKE